MKPITLALRVLRALQLAPMTIAELARCLSSHHSAVRRKVDELAAAGMAAPTGEVKHSHGRKASLWGIA